MRTDGAPRIPIAGLAVPTPEWPYRRQLALPMMLLAALAGCAVPQPPGKGRCMRMVEADTRTSYWLYLPEPYVNSKETDSQNVTWPAVVTLHGLRPYDNAAWQEREWQEEADRYGLIVVAPDLWTCDSLTMQFPLKDPTLSYVRRDEQAILAVMSEVVQRDHADPGRVLITGFSSGGYLAHYMFNRHPERFSCLVVRQSNFSESLLDAGRIDESVGRPILILNTQNDFSACRRESAKAMEWYASHGYMNVAVLTLRALGHERTPDVAAVFFAKAAGIERRTDSLGDIARRKAVDGNARGLALLGMNSTGPHRDPGTSDVVLTAGTGP